MRMSPSSLATLTKASVETLVLRRGLSALLTSPSVSFSGKEYTGFLCSKELASSRRRFSNASTLSSGVTNKMTDQVVQGAAGGSGGSGVNGGGDRSKCVFCKIADGKEGNEIYYQDDEIVVFQDIKPAATHHLLVVTREHIRDSKSLLPSHLGLLERLIQVGNKVLLEQIQKQAPETQNLDQIQKLTGFHWPPFHTVSHLHLHVVSPSDKMGFISRTIFRPNSYWFVTPEYVKERLEKMEADSKSSPNNGNNPE